MDALEVYVLSGERSSEVAARFLNEFAPTRYPVATDFPFPEFADNPDMVYDDPAELIGRLETERSQPYSIYWNVEGRGSAEQVMLFFTEDGGMVAGLGGPQDSPEVAMTAIQKIVNGKFGYVTSDTCPPSSIDEFVSLCEQSTLVNLFEGELRSP